MTNVRFAVVVASIEHDPADFTVQDVDEVTLDSKVFEAVLDEVPLLILGHPKACIDCGPQREAHQEEHGERDGVSQ